MFYLVHIQGREPHLRDFVEKKTLLMLACIQTSTDRLLSNSTKLYILISILMTLIFIQGHSSGPDQVNHRGGFPPGVQGVA